MGIGCGATLMKYILFLFNIIFFICGAGILGMSIWILVDDNIRDYISIATNANGNDFIAVALYFLCAVGAFTFLVGLLGCCGACQESSCMLCTYAVLVGIIFVLQIGAAITAAVFKDEIKTGLEDSMSDQVNKYFANDIEDATTRIWSRMQYDWECCGGKNHLDYRKSTYTNDSGNAVPPTCCFLTGDDPLKPVVRDYDKCKQESLSLATNPTELHNKGCHDRLRDFIDEHTGIIIGVAFGLAAFQVLCIIFAVCVRSKVNELDNYA